MNGKLDDGHQIRTSSLTSTLSNTDVPGHSSFIYNASSYDWRSPQNDNLWQGNLGINNPCPAGWRLPIETELNNERLGWSENNMNGAINSSLKLPVSGYRDYNGSLGWEASRTYYWASTIKDNWPTQYSRALYFSSSEAAVYDAMRVYGFSIRCIKD